MGNIKWGRAVVWMVLGAIIAIVLAMVWSVVGMLPRGFQLRGTPPREEQIAWAFGPVYNAVAAVITGLVALLSGRSTARKAEGGYTLNGLLVGIGVGILVAVYGVFSRGEFTFWPVLHAILGVAGGWLGGMLGGKRAEADEMYD